ncbi:hypothetical protein Tco_1484706 [Tanacetum coccineum]
MRNRLFMHTIKEDSVLGRLKFVTKNEDNQVYGKTIPDNMVSKEIKESPPYKTYFAYATGLAIPKKARKGSKAASQQKKASSVTASDDSEPKPAKKPTGRRKPAGVVTKDTPDVSKKKTPVQTQKHKGMEMLSDAGGSSDGVGSQPEVPNEPKGTSVDTSEGAGSKPEVLDVTESDDEKSIDLNKVDNEEETQEDEFVHTPDDYLPTDDKTQDVDDEKYDRINKEMYDDVNVELKYAKLANEGKRDEEMTDAEKHEAQETTTAAPATQKEKIDVPPSSSSKSVSSNYSSIFLNLDNISSVETEIISMLDVQVQQEIPSNQSSSLLIVPVSIIPEPSIIKPIPEIVLAAPTTTIPPPTPLFIPYSQQSTPIPTPITTKATTLTPTLKNVDHSTTLLATIKSEVPSAVKEYLGTILGDALHKQESQYTIKSSNKAALNEFDQKQALFDTITESKSFNKHPKHKALYHAHMESILADEEAIDQSVANLDKQNKRKHVDDVRDEDPPAGLDQGLKRRKTSKDAEPPKRLKSTGSSKAMEMPHNQGDDMGTTDDQPNVEAASKKDCDLAKAKKPPLTFNELMRYPIDFSAYARNHLKISNMIKADLVGLEYNLLKGTCISYVELEYNMGECYKALTDQLVWNNHKGNRCPLDLSKPLPLVESRGRQIVPANYFFNNDLEYLRGGSTSRKYTTSITKTKAAKVSKHDVYSTKRILAVTNVIVNKWYGYGHLEEIEVRRAYQKLYKFMEGNFLRLHLNNIEDMLLLIIQHKLFNLNGDVIVNLAMALHMFTRRIVIQKRVEYLQLGVKSNYKKLNITRPHTYKNDISNLVPYTTYSDPQGVIYEDKLNRKRLMRSNKLYKFSDSTLKSVRDTLHDMKNNLRMGYNNAMPRWRWGGLYKRRSQIMVKEIDQ